MGDETSARRLRAGKGPAVAATPAAPEPKDDPRLNMALARGLEVLRAFGAGKVYLGNGEIARETGIPKASVSRLTYTLSAYGYLNFSPEIGKYYVSPGILALGYTVLAQHPVHVQARPLMERMAIETGSVVGLAVRDGLHMVFLEYAKGETAVTRDTSVGLRVPIGASAMGWACLAGMSRPDREAALDQLRRAAGADHWPAQAARIDSAMAEVWAHGYCISHGDIDPVVNAAAVPLLRHDGAGAYALNCMAPAYAMGRERIAGEIGPRLLGLAEALRGGAPRTATPTQ